MREWTQIGFSSIYYVLSKLEQRGLIKADSPANAKAKKSYEKAHRSLRTLPSSCRFAIASSFTV